MGSPAVSVVKNMPAMLELQVQSLEEEMATHCSILAWRIPWAEEPGGLQSVGSQRVRHSQATEQQLISNIAMVSADHRRDSTLSVYVSTLLQTPFLFSFVFPKFLGAMPEALFYMGFPRCSVGKEFAFNATDITQV